jgi:hypothetical protein
MSQQKDEHSHFEDSVVAMLRIKPISEDQKIFNSTSRSNTPSKSISSKNKRSLLPTSDNSVSHLKTGKSFEFTKVFNEDSTNKDVFETTILPNIEGVLRGISFCAFTYGQTSSGKTFTTKGNISKAKDAVGWLECNLGPHSSPTPLLSNKRKLREPRVSKEYLSPLIRKSFSSRGIIDSTPSKRLSRGRLSINRDNRKTFEESND